MAEERALLPLSRQKQQMLAALRQCNELSAGFGLWLTEQEMQELTEKRFAVLRASGRVEFGGGILPQLIRAFYGSPNLSRHNYADTLLELQDAFYYFKNESLDLYSDAELLELMRAYFDGPAQGSLEYLCGTSLEELCRAKRFGSSWQQEEEDDDDD